MSDLNLYRDKAIGAYLGLAIGDALGATVEFMTASEIKLQYGKHQDITGGGWLNLKPGQITDDTSMSLALGQCILENQGVNAYAIAHTFSDWLRSNPIDVGNTVRRGIVHFRYGGNPVVPENEFDAGNGACMRTLPIAISTLFLTEDQIRNYSKHHTHTTHNHVLSDAATECVLLMIQDALLGSKKSTLKSKWVEPMLEENPVLAFENTRKENPSGYIVETLQAVFQAFFENSNFEDSLIDVVNRGGDADTTGAILGMLTGAYYGVAAIPNHWLSSLDSNIRLACEQQASDLLNFALTSNQAAIGPNDIAVNG